jgi:hypothetical protein
VKGLFRPIFSTRWRTARTPRATAADPNGLVSEVTLEKTKKELRASVAEAASVGTAL